MGKVVIQIQVGIRYPSSFLQEPAEKLLKVKMFPSLKRHSVTCMLFTESEVSQVKESNIYL